MHWCTVMLEKESAKVPCYAEALGTVFLAISKPKLVYWIARLRGMIHLSTGHFFSTVEPTGVVVYMAASSSLKHH